MLLELLSQTSGKFLFESRLFSTAVASILAFCLAMGLFQPYIRFLNRFQFNTEFERSPTGMRQPVMPGGLLFLVIILFTCLITARFNSYVISALVIYVFFSIIGAVDDLAKIINKRKVMRGQLSKESYQYKADGISANLRLALYFIISGAVAIVAYKYIPNINGHFAVPFMSITKTFPYLPFWFFIPFMTFAIVIMVNGVNFTDGFDTLATVPLITCSVFVGVIAYISSHSIWSRYLLIPYIPGVDEILPIIGAVIGTLLAFLWFNSPPASVYMGDCGSVSLGGMIGIMFIFIKAGFYLPIIGLVFFAEFLSSFLQMFYYKLTKKRLFLMAPLHHHFQLAMRSRGYYGGEANIKSKIAWRFHIVSLLLLIIGTILFLKVR
ncbi:MAG: phospho-N-acetylmuramoyl-pentapeptide-transferase [Chitinivibrionales bacterium]|nr:phospho-N-acetylmuramoyl-pentapeptide-transferase [Chitinivibrionales bacterium]